MNCFLKSLKVDVENDIRLYFAPLIGAYRAVMTEWRKVEEKDNK